MGLFSQPKYVGYNFTIHNFQTGLDFQDLFVGVAVQEYKLDLYEASTPWRGDGYIDLKYDCESRKEPPVIVYITDFTVLIAFEETYIDDEKVQHVMDIALNYYSEKGIFVRYQSQTKPIKKDKIFEYMLATAGLY